MRFVPSQTRALAAGLLLVTALCALAPAAALALSPALALLVAVLAGLFTGDQAIRLVRRALRRRRQHASQLCAPRSRPSLDLCRGGLLVAASLASRPPPALG